MLLTGIYIFHFPEGMLLLHMFVRCFRDPEGSLLLHTVARFFRNPEGSLPSHTVRAFHPRSRRIVSVGHTIRFIHAPEGTLLLRTAHTLLSLPRRVASGAHVANAFLDSEESVPTNALHIPSTVPKNSFRPMRCTFLPRSRRIASVMHSSRIFHAPEGSLPLRSAFLPFCRSSEEYRQCVERKVCFTRRADRPFPHVRPKPIVYQLTIQRAQLSQVLKIHAGTFHYWIPPRMLTRCAFHNSPKPIVSFASSRPSFLSGHLLSASRSFDLSAFGITVGNSGRCPTPVKYSEEYRTFIAGRSGCVIMIFRSCAGQPHAA